MARRVVDPTGVEWRMRRRWLHAPVSPRWRGGGDALDLVDAPGAGLADGLFGAVAVVLTIIALAALVAFLLVPLAILVLEVLLFLLLAAIGLLGRVVLRRPWLIEARGDGGRARTWRVAGWRDSREAIETIAAALRDGREPALGLSSPR